MIQPQGNYPNKQGAAANTGISVRSSAGGQSNQKTVA